MAVGHLPDSNLPPGLTTADEHFYDEDAPCTCGCDLDDHDDDGPCRRCGDCDGYEPFDT